MPDTNEQRANRPPQLDKILRHPMLEERANSFNRALLARLGRQILDEIRTLDKATAADFEMDKIVALIIERSNYLQHGNLRKVLNGTGVILNTNLGRAPLSRNSIDRVAEILSGYSNLEMELARGTRGERIGVIEEQLQLLVGCESALTVNNNAAAVMLAVTALAKDKEVIVSRGELVEIGGSFRLPDVIEAAGGVLKEVGTTNRTRIDDYRKAVTERTGMIIRCHRSNFEITGFTEETALSDLVAMAKEKQIPFVEDLGSGAILDLKGLSNLSAINEPTVPSVVGSGADLVLFSGDKLLGGPQCGIVAGKHQFVERLRRHPIYRALRSDKLTVAILEQTLACYLHPQPQDLLPAYKAATATIEHLRDRAERIISAVEAHLTVLQIRSVECSSAFGGGTTPGVVIPSVGLCLEAGKNEALTITADRISKALRTGSPPVVTTVRDSRVLIDLRSILDFEDMDLKDALLKTDARL